MRVYNVILHLTQR